MVYITLTGVCVEFHKVCRNRQVILVHFLLIHCLGKYKFRGSWIVAMSRFFVLSYISVDTLKSRAWKALCSFQSGYWATSSIF